MQKNFFRFSFTPYSEAHPKLDFLLVQNMFVKTFSEKLRSNYRALQIHPLAANPCVLFENELGQIGPRLKVLDFGFGLGLDIKI